MARNERVRKWIPDKKHAATKLNHHIDWYSTKYDDSGGSIEAKRDQTKGLSQVQHKHQSTQNLMALNERVRKWIPDKKHAATKLNHHIDWQKAKHDYFGGGIDAFGPHLSIMNFFTGTNNFFFWMSFLMKDWEERLQCKKYEIGQKITKITKKW